MQILIKYAVVKVQNARVSLIQDKHKNKRQNREDSLKG